MSRASVTPDITDFYAAEASQSSEFEPQLLSVDDDHEQKAEALENFYLAGLVSMCAKRWRKVTNLGDELAEFYREQMEEDQTNTRFPIAKEDVQSSPVTSKKLKPAFVGNKKLKPALVGNGSYDSTMTAFDFEREAAIEAVP